MSIAMDFGTGGEMRIYKWQEDQGLMPLIMTAWIRRNNATLRTYMEYVDGPEASEQSSLSDMAMDNGWFDQDDVLDHQEWMQSRKKWMVHSYVAANEVAAEEEKTVYYLVVYGLAGNAAGYDKQKSKLIDMGYTEEEVASVPLVIKVD